MNDISLQNFKESATEALGDAKLQRALTNVKRGFIVKRSLARSRLPEFGALREEARVLVEEAVRRLREIAELVRDAERRALEDGDLRQVRNLGRSAPGSPAAAA